MIEGSETEMIAGDIVDEETTKMVAMTVEDGEPSVPQYILQSPPNYKMELLKYIHGLESDAILDFPIFLQDGVSLIFETKRFFFIFAFL